jgi:hypothetical protein
MKNVVFLGIMIAVMSVPGFAINRDSAKVDFATPVRVGSSDLPAGEYKAIWTGAGSEVQVSFVQGKKVIATSSAKLTETDNVATTSHTPNGVEVVTTQEGNTTVLQELRLPHLNLSFEDNAKVGQ